MATKSIDEIRAEMAARKNARKPTVSENGASEAPPAENRPQIVPQRTRQQPQEIVLPHSVEAEQGVLGSMLISPKTVIPEVTRQLSADFFYVASHQTIFMNMVALYNDQRALDLITFTQYLRDRALLETVGGASLVTSLFTFVPTAANVGYYIDIVREKFALRRFIAGATDNLRRAQEEQEDVPALFELAQRQMEDVKLALAGSMDDVERFGFEDLLKFDPRADPDNLVGFRWCCRGFTCLWAGASGMGKSSLEMQLAIYWGCGLPVFGMTPVRPLKSLIVQAENDLGDTGEQLQGVLEGIQKAEDMRLSDTRRALIESNVVINRVIALTGEKFCALLESLVQMHKPDLVWIDPLFAFAGCDLKEAASASAFLREQLFPIAVRNKVCLHLIHHVGKPDRDSKAKSGWTDLDFQYLGFGSSEIQNAFRAVNIMLPVSGEEKVFRLILSKRGGRAGAKTPEGEPTTNVYLTHAKEGICWLQVDKPDEPEKTTSKETQFQSKFTPESVLGEMSVTEGRKASALQKHMKAETGMAEKTFYRIWSKLKESGRIRVDSDGLWVINARSQNDQN